MMDGNHSMIHDCRHVHGWSVRKDSLLTTLWSPSSAAPGVLLLGVHRDIVFHEILEVFSRQWAGKIWWNFEFLVNAQCFLKKVNPAFLERVANLTGEKKSDFYYLISFEQGSYRVIF